MSLKKMSRRPFWEGLSCEPRCSNCTTPPFSPKLAAAGRQSWQNIDNIKNIEKYWKHWQNIGSWTTILTKYWKHWQNIGSCSTILTKYWKHWQNIDSWSTILAKHYICAVFVNSTNITTNIERAVLYIAAGRRSWQNIEQQHFLCNFQADNSNTRHTKKGKSLQEVFE